MLGAHQTFPPCVILTREGTERWVTSGSGPQGAACLLAGFPSSSADAAVLWVAGCQGHPGCARPWLGYQWGAPHQLLPGTASAPLLLFKASSTQGKEKKKKEKEITRETEVSSSESGAHAGAMCAGAFHGMLPAGSLGLS